MPCVLPDATHFQIVVTVLASLKVLATVIGASTPLPTRFQPGIKLIDTAPGSVVVVVLATVVVVVLRWVVVVLVVVVVVVTANTVVLVVVAVVVVEVLVVVVVVVVVGAAGLTALDAAEAGPVPIPLLAVTVKLYGVPSMSPVTVIGPAVPVAVMPPGLDVTV